MAEILARLTKSSWGWTPLSPREELPFLNDGLGRAYARQPMLFCMFWISCTPLCLPGTLGQNTMVLTWESLARSRWSRVPCYTAEHACWPSSSWVILEGKGRSVKSSSKWPLSLPGAEGNEKQLLKSWCSQTPTTALRCNFMDDLI